MTETVQLDNGETVFQGGDQATDLTVSGDGTLNLGHDDLGHILTINAPTISVNLNHDFNGSTLYDAGGMFMVGRDASNATFNVSDGGTVELSRRYRGAEFNLSGQNNDLTFGVSGNSVQGNSLRIKGITGLDVGDQVELNGQTFTSATFNGNKITLSNGFQINNVSFAAGSPRTFSVGIDPATGFNYLKVAAVCYLAGTQIATTEGEVAVERLAVGDLVLTLGGEARRIVWIGMGRVLAARGRRNMATPVIVRKNALGDNVPHRDLRVTKAHSLFIEGVLIPAEFLVNHRTILWDDHAQEVTIYHIELETHDVLLANGAPAESYRDDGNRWLFQNANSGWGLPPQEPCAPVLTGGPIVDAAWWRLLERAGPRLGVPTTDDPDLHLLVDGQRVNAASRNGMLHIFRLAARPATVRIVSRSGVPQELGVARDPRCLGVGIRQITVTQGKRVRAIGAEDKRLAVGFHPFEADNDLRWTDGDAAMPEELLAGFTGPLEITLRLGGGTTYVDEGTRRRVA